jgi:cyanophycinase-like exopeptidase
LGGRKNAHIVLIPTANNPGDDIAPVVKGLKQVFGVPDVAVLDTKDRTKADSAEFVAPLKQATFVFIDGGRQWRLADAYLGTRVERELRNVLKRGETVVAAHPNLFGIGIDPNTIIVVQGNQFEAIGSGSVTITEAGHQQYLIPSGSHFDLRKPKPLTPR